MNIKILKLLLVSILFIAVSTTKANAEGAYDGIYAVPNLGYAYIRENQGQLVVVLNQTVSGNLIWGASQGTLNGSSARLRSIAGYVSTVVDLYFTSPNSFSAIQISCSGSCLVPNGTTFTGSKIW